MELTLIRSYYPDGTNGELFCAGKRVCSTIELPWLDNRQNVSCVPEGRYELRKRYALPYGDHVWVKDVPGREWILMHPATDALKHLKGCIAPVTSLDGPGKGSRSRQAQDILLALVAGAVSRTESIFLTIKSTAL